MVKIEATFPKRDNEGNAFTPAEYRTVEGYLLARVGGYTVTECKGAWVAFGNGNTYYDDSFVYCVVVDDMDKANRVMADLKYILLNNFSQLSAWITYHDINTF